MIGPRVGPRLALSLRPVPKTLKEKKVKCIPAERFLRHLMQNFLKAGVHKHNDAIKLYVGVEIQLQTFLTLALAVSS